MRSTKHARWWIGSTFVQTPQPHTVDDVVEVCVRELTPRMAPSVLRWLAAALSQLPQPRQKGVAGYVPFSTTSSSSVPMKELHALAQRHHRPTSFISCAELHQHVQQFAPLVLKINVVDGDAEVEWQPWATRSLRRKLIQACSSTSSASSSRCAAGAASSAANHCIWPTIFAIIPSTYFISAEVMEDRLRELSVDAETYSVIMCNRTNINERSCGAASAIEWSCDGCALRLQSYEACVLAGCPTDVLRQHGSANNLYRLTSDGDGSHLLHHVLEVLCALVPTTYTPMNELRQMYATMRQHLPTHAPLKSEVWRHFPSVECILLHPDVRPYVEISDGFAQQHHVDGATTSTTCARRVLLDDCSARLHQHFLHPRRGEADAHLLILANLHTTQDAGDASISWLMLVHASTGMMEAVSWLMSDVSEDELRSSKTSVAVAVEAPRKKHVCGRDADDDNAGTCRRVVMASTRTPSASGGAPIVRAVSWIHDAPTTNLDGLLSSICGALHRDALHGEMVLWCGDDATHKMHEGEDALPMIVQLEHLADIVGCAMGTAPGLAGRILRDCGMCVDGATAHMTWDVGSCVAELLHRAAQTAVAGRLLMAMTQDEPQHMDWRALVKNLPQGSSRLMQHTLRRRWRRYLRHLPPDAPTPDVPSLCSSSTLMMLKLWRSLYGPEPIARMAVAAEVLRPALRASAPPPMEAATAEEVLADVDAIFHDDDDDATFIDSVLATEKDGEAATPPPSQTYMSVRQPPKQLPTSFCGRRASRRGGVPLSSASPHISSSAMNALAEEILEDSPSSRHHRGMGLH